MFYDSVSQTMGGDPLLGSDSRLQLQLFSYYTNFFVFFYNLFFLFIYYIIIIQYIAFYIL